MHSTSCDLTERGQNELEPNDEGPYEISEWVIHSNHPVLPKTAARKAGSKSSVHGLCLGKFDPVTFAQYDW